MEFEDGLVMVICGGGFSNNVLHNYQAMSKVELKLDSLRLPYCMPAMLKIV